MALTDRPDAPNRAGGDLKVGSPTSIEVGKAFSPEGGNTLKAATKNAVPAAMSHFSQLSFNDSKAGEKPGNPPEYPHAGEPTPTRKSPPDTTPQTPKPTETTPPDTQPVPRSVQPGGEKPPTEPKPGGSDTQPTVKPTSPDNTSQDPKQRVVLV